MRIPVTQSPDPTLDSASQLIAVKADKAAALLSISRMTLWRRVKLGEIQKLSCGTYSISELRRYASSQPAKVEKPTVVRRKAA